MVNSLSSFIYSNLDSFPPIIKLMVFPFLFILFFILKLIKAKKKNKVIFSLIKKIINRIVRQNLEYHNVFISLNINISKISNIDLKNKNKTKVFKILLNTQLAEIKKLLIEIMGFKNIKSLNSENLYLKICKAMLTHNSAFKTQVNAKIHTKYPNIDSKKLTYLIAGNANKELTMSMNTLLLYVEKLANSTIYDDNYERITAFFDMVDTIITALMLDAENNFTNFNGNFDSFFK